MARFTKLRGRIRWIRKTRSFFYEDYIGSENNLDEPCVRCVRRKVRDIRSPIFLFSLLIIYISVRLFRDSWIGLDWLRNKQRTKILIN